MSETKTLQSHFLVYVVVISLCVPPRFHSNVDRQGSMVQQLAHIPWAGCPVALGTRNGVAERRPAYAHDS